MPYYDRDNDWAEQVPQRSFRGPYEDYGWEQGQSVLPQFRDPSTHRMPYDTSRQDYGRTRAGRYEEDWRDYPAWGEESRQPPYGYRADRYRESSRHSYGAPSTYARPTQGNYDDLYRWQAHTGQPAQRYAYDDQIRGPWRVPGPHVGRGPQSYQRSDQRIQEDVCDRLTFNGQLDAADIEVEAKQGEVTLRGTVDSRQAKRLAEDLAESVTGVRDVHNRLTWQARSQRQNEQRREIGVPGGGQGRVDQVGRSGVYPASAQNKNIPDDAEAQPMASWGQGERGAAGYEDSGTSEVWYTEEELRQSREKKE